MSKKILIIEDNEAISRSISYALTDADYEVECATDPLKGISEANTGEYDLILLDIVMPDYSGYDVMEKINVNPDIKKTPVVIFSNLDRPEDKELIKKLGAIGLISKADMDSQQVATQVKKFLDEV